MMTADNLNTTRSYDRTIYRGSHLEISLMIQILEADLPKPEREHRFHDKRRWRFDFAWPEQMIAAEIEGGTFKKSRHTSGTGFHRDCEKYHQATAPGWQVLRFDSNMVSNGQALEVILGILT